MLILLIIALTLLGAAVFMVAEVRTEPARERRATLARAAGAPQGQFSTDLVSVRERLVDPLVRELADAATKLGGDTRLERIRTRLVAAGLHRRISPAGFLAVQAAAGISGVALGVVLGIAKSSAGGGLVVAAALGALGVLVPDFLLSRKARLRRDEIASELPKAIDLIAVSVEAGLGFDAALTHLLGRFKGGLADEFGLMLAEMRIGEPRDEALRRLSERIGHPDVDTFVRAVVQSDQLGMPLSRILRVQADELRLRRQQNAEEKATKAPVKMLVPTAIFIFPVLFIVVLAPAMLNLHKLFG